MFIPGQFSLITIFLRERIYLHNRHIVDQVPDGPPFVPTSEMTTTRGLLPTVG
ncbi:MAG: hypothetical protein KFF73_08330 [Cyclobacteriaceae bacterium]|nr:hypothetical protein [Cyclobacteriaceae bacterium]